MEDDSDQRDATGEQHDRDPARRPAAGSRAGRASAAVLGAAAMLVLSFGPSALALSPSSSATPTPQTSRVVTSLPAQVSGTTAPSRSDDDAAESPRDRVDSAD